MLHSFRLKACCLLILWMNCFVLHGVTVTDTLPSPRSSLDRVIISYDINYNDGRVSIRFNKPRKLLSSGNYNRYKNNLNEVKALFFSKNGGFGNQVLFTGKPITPFTKPYNVRLHENDGYFRIDDEPSISFDIANGEKPTLEIPIYLAKYSRHKKTTTYDVFSSCGTLSIKLFKEASKRTSKTIAVEGTPTYETRQIKETVAETVEADNNDDVTFEAEAVQRINTIRELLPQQDRLPFDESLSNCIDGLRPLEYKVSGSLQSTIRQVLSECDRKKRSLEDAAEEEQQAVQAAAEQKAKDEAQAAEAKVKDAEEQAKEEQKKSEKRNMWMIIGAMILGLLGFGGNQVAQHMRNAKNQKSMMEMQQNVIKRAENEAKRRAQSYARNKAHQVVGQAKQKGRQAVRSNVNKLGNSVKGNNKASGNNNKNGNSNNNKNDKGGISI